MVEEEILSDQDFFAAETRKRRENENKRLDRTNESDVLGKKLKKQIDRRGAGATTGGRKLSSRNRSGAI